MRVEIFSLTREMEGCVVVTEFKGEKEKGKKGVGLGGGEEREAENLFCLGRLC